MFELVFFSIVFTLVLGYYIKSIQFSSKKLPPGPFVMPFGIGNGLTVLWRYPGIFRTNSFRTWELFDNLAKEYGNLYFLSSFGYKIVVLSSYELLTEVAHLEEYSSKFSSEIHTYPRTFGKELGIAFTSTKQQWSEMRNFAIRTLKEFGFTKRDFLCGTITNEATVVANTFEKAVKEKNGLLRIHNTFTLAALNVTWSMVAGTRYSHDDPEINLIHNTFHYAKAANVFSPRTYLASFLNYYAPWALPSKLGEHYQFNSDFHGFSKRIVDKRKASGMYLSTPQNYVDIFLQKIRDSQNDPESLYTEEQLQAMIEDLMVAGTETINETLCFALLFLILNPEMQTRLQKEIDDVLSSTGDLSLVDFRKMSFLQAFILETHRYISLVPIPIPRLAPNDWNLRGYHIPKGTVIMSNHYGINYSKDIWGDPNTFRPDRFIDEEGIFVSDPRVVIFGFGKRNCFGISVAELSLPIFLVTILQRYNLAVVPGTPTPSTEPVVGNILSSRPFQVLVSRRASTSHL